MKYSTYLLTLLAAAIPVSAADTPIEFAAYLRTGDGAERFVLAEPARGAVSGWIALGQSFSGYFVTKYQPEREVLIAVKNGLRYELRLKQPKVADGYNQAAAAESVVRMTLRKDGTLQISGKTLPLESVAAHLHGLARQNPTPVSYSVFAESRAEPEVMDIFKAQLLRAIPQRHDTVVKIQGGVPPSQKK